METPRLESVYPVHFVNNDFISNNKKYLANMFNNYLSNIGSKLSYDITVPTNASIYNYLENRKNHNLFLNPVRRKLSKLGIFGNV